MSPKLLLSFKLGHGFYVALGIGIDHCSWITGVEATSITLATDTSSGVRYDYYILVKSETNGQFSYDLYKKE